MLLPSILGVDGNDAVGPVTMDEFRLIGGRPGVADPVGRVVSELLPFGVGKEVGSEPVGPTKIVEFRSVVAKPVGTEPVGPPELVVLTLEVGSSDGGTGNVLFGLSKTALTSR